VSPEQKGEPEVPERLCDRNQRGFALAAVMMSATTIALILGAVTCSAAGQLLLKSGAGRLGGLGRLDFLLAASQDMRILSGLAAWFAWTVCWVYVLRVAPLSRAYALTSLNYVLIPLASVYMLGEQVRRLHVVGIILIAAGISCVLAGD
jgi:uncharacterized membrane protein